MKRGGILNAELCRAIATLGHTDGLAISDAGLPIPTTVDRIDLAVVPGLPGFLAVLDAILREMIVERVLLAEEIKTQNPGLHRAVLQRLDAIPVAYVPHEGFKRRVAVVRAVARTGECTPYANVILYSGVAELFAR